MTSTSPKVSSFFVNTTALPNITSNAPDPTQTMEFRTTKIFFYFFILICSTFGNSMVIWIIGSTRKMRTASNFLILNLAICDLVTPLASIPFDFALEENGYSWSYGGFMCKFLWPCATLTATSSSLTLAAISLDRYRIIMHPFKTRLSSKQIQIIIGTVHLTSAVFVLPYIYVLELKGDSCEETWTANFELRKWYTLVLFLVQYGLPLVFMIVMYTLAVKSLRLATGKMRKTSIRGTSTKPGGKVRFSLWSSPNAKATKMFIIVVLVYAIFMFPNQALWMWMDFGQHSTNPYLPVIQVICWLFTYTNSVCNPAIYYVFSQDFKNGFKRLQICCRICNKRHKGHYVSAESATAETNLDSAVVGRTMNISLER